MYHVPRNNSLNAVSADSTAAPAEWARYLREWVPFEGASYEPPWDGTLDHARRIVREVLPDLAAQVKADRGRLHGRHPWDD